ncbi:hypothetical protein Tco_0169621 [Tanacetum coccineum]
MEGVRLIWGDKEVTRRLGGQGDIMKESSSGSASAPSSSAPSASSKRMRSNDVGARPDVAWEFKHHLARTHQNVGACTRVPEDVKVKMQNILEQNKLNSMKRKGMFMIKEVEKPFKRGKVQQNTVGN